ncbi:hypothetical protein [Maribacter sp.]|uniref:hypothetical protein n=1 Tax=Maribacter sp. TaxID=1897614 RepID=UPI0025BA47E7|nr:hypothetical protein [Maribacter sp.]
MIDYLQTYIKDKDEVQKLWANPLLCFKNDIQKRSDLTGEIYQKQTKEFEGITFRKEPHAPNADKEGKERIVLGFKPHYWYNNNLHNANDFNIVNCINTITRFIELFEIKDFEKYPINNLEYGLNFILEGYGKELISFNSYHSRNQFIQDADQRYSKKAIKFNPSTGLPDKYLMIKFYSKGFEFPDYCNRNTQRFEVKTKKSKKIKALGIYTIGDLITPGIYQNLKDDILKASHNVLIIDPKPNIENLNNREQNQLDKYSNSGFWYETINQKRSHAFNEKKKLYFKYLDKTGYNINREFTKVIAEKLNLLFIENGNYSPPPKKNENGNYSPLDKGGIVTVLDNRVCPITGMDISMQKEGASLLSNTGLKHLHKTNKIKFDELKEKLLTGQSNRYEKTIFDMMSKQIRNRYYNNIPITQQTVLFDNTY